MADLPHTAVVLRTKTPAIALFKTQWRVLKSHIGCFFGRFGKNTTIYGENPMFSTISSFLVIDISDKYY
jgi:hypothetical protein